MRPRELPDDIDDAIDDIAYVHHWPLGEIAAMSLEDVSRWWARARRRIEAARGG